MSSGSAGSRKEPSELNEAVELLRKAQSLIDTLDRPEIGARLQDVIDLLRSPGGSDRLNCCSSGEHPS
jgi:hypothetical protein